MSLIPYKITAIRSDDDGSNKNIVPFASVSILTEVGAVASVFSNSAGSALSNPFTLDANGEKTIWVEPGIYQTSIAGGAYFSTYISSTTTEDFTSAEKTKLAGIQAGASANATNAQLRDRATHTGVQAISTVSNLQPALDIKLDKASVKANLSSPNTTDAASTLAVADALANANKGQNYKGLWNSLTNNPVIVSSTGTAGDFYDVGVPSDGVTTIDGIDEWPEGSKIIFNGSIWEKNAAPNVRSVDGQIGDVILNYDTPAQAALASLPVGAKYSTKGADAVGDGGHGNFIVEAASGTPDVYGRTLLANGNHGVLQPVNGYYSAAQFGEDFELAFAFSKFVKGTPGYTYNLSAALSCDGVDVDIDAHASNFIVPEDTYLINIKGGWEYSEAVTATTENTITVADASSYAPEDVIKIVSDAALPINIDGGLKGEFCVIDEITSGELLLGKPLLWDYSADTGVAIHKLKNTKIKINIGSGKQSGVGAGTAELIYVEAVKNPCIYINRIEYANRGGGVAVSCYGGKFEIEYIDYSGIWYEPEMRQRGGYGLVPTNSEYMTMRIGVSHRGRHVYDGAGDERGDLVPSRHGASAYNIFETCKSICGVDTDYAQHQGTYKNTFINPWSFGSGGFASFRGVGHRILGGGAIGITGPFAGNIVGTTTPNTVTDDNELIGCVLRGGNSVIASSSDTTSGKLKFTRCDMETNFASSSTRVFTTAGTGISLRDCKIKVSGLISSGIFSVLSSVESIEMINCELDLSDATLTSVRLINNQSGGVSISSTLVFRLDGNTFITHAGFINLISHVSLPAAGSIIGDNKIRGSFTKISSNFTDSEMAPYVDGDVVYNREPLMRPSSGGSVTQSTSKGNSVTLNKMCGRIITSASNLAANSAESFLLLNSRIGANDNVICHRVSGGFATTYAVTVDAVSAGQANITIRNFTATDRAESITLQFSVVRSSIA